MIGIGFIHFRTLGLDHLDAALYTLARQDFTGVEEVLLLDNNSEAETAQVAKVFDAYRFPVTTECAYLKHGWADRTQSWSVNEVFRRLRTEWVFLCRSDFLLDYRCLALFRAEVEARSRSWRGFVTSYCHQMGYDAALSNTDALAPYSLPTAEWRQDPRGPSSLVGQVPANYFHTTDQDAGVWLLRRECHTEVGGLNEQMVSWGYQQQAFQRALRRRGVEIVNIPEYLFHHQHHYANRDFAQAAAELRFEVSS